MTVSGQQSANTDFFLRPVNPAPEPGRDTVLHYADFLADSLNTFEHDTVFRFELKEIILPVTKSDADSSKAVKVVPSVFSRSGVHSPTINPDSRTEKNYDGITAFFLVCMVVLAWIRVNNFRRIKQVARAIAGRHNVNQLVRDGNLSQERITPGLILIYLTSLAVLVFHLGNKIIYAWLGIKLNDFMLFIAIIFAIALLWLLKIITIKITGFIFRTKQDTSELILTNLIFNASTGIAMFPFILAGFYSGYAIFFQIGAIILATGMILRFFRNLVVGFSAQTFSVMYLFLYLCTLEILPVLFLYRIITFTD